MGKVLSLIEPQLAPFSQPKIRVPLLALGAIVLLMGNSLTQRPNPLPAANNGLVECANSSIDQGEEQPWTTRVRHRSRPGAPTCIGGPGELIRISAARPATAVTEVEANAAILVNRDDVTVIRGTQVLVNRLARRNHPNEPVVLPARWGQVGLPVPPPWRCW